MAGLLPSRNNNSGVVGKTHGAGLRDFPSLVRRMQEEFDDLVALYSRDFPLAARGSNWRWGVEVENNEDSVVVRAEAPGFEANDFDIQVSDNQLLLRAVHKKESKEKTGEYREQHECYEAIPLPTGIDKETINARYRNGVLTVTIPKTKEGQSTKISVKT